jgi:hypothetical protein
MRSAAPPRPGAPGHTPNKGAAAVHIDAAELHKNLSAVAKSNIDVRASILARILQPSGMERTLTIRLLVSLH